MEINEQYKKFTDQFKKIYVLRAICGALALLLVIAFIFIPFFSINLEIDETVIWEHNFSIYDELDLKTTSTENSYYSFLTTLIIYFILIPIIYIAKNLYCMTKAESFVLRTIKKIKEGKHFSEDATIALLYIAVLLMPLMSRLFTNNSDVASYLNECNGVNWTILFVILAFGAAVAALVYTRIQYKKIETAILKEDDDEDTANKEQVNTETAN